MDVVLVNSDLTTGDTLRDLAKCIPVHDLLVDSYHETTSAALQQSGDQICLNRTIRCDIDDVNSLVAVAPGPLTLRFVHSLMKNDLDKRTAPPQIGLHLPEFWIIQKLETLDKFGFEVFYTYASACLAVGYSRLSMTCVSQACGEYYARTMLGGYRPRTLALMDVFMEFGVARPSPLSLA